MRIYIVENSRKNIFTVKNSRFGRKIGNSTEWGVRNKGAVATAWLRGPGWIIRNGPGWVK